MSLNEKDFVVLGKNPVTDMVVDGNVITLFNILGYRSGYVSFVKKIILELQEVLLIRLMKIKLKIYMEKLKKKK